jgi:hypothetical protein
MQPVAQIAHATTTSAWRVSRDGSPVAVVDLREEGGNVVVAAEVEGAAKAKPYRFASFEAADAFVRDLIASFAYLGCDVVVD